jgi:hypothetical protein
MIKRATNPRLWLVQLLEDTQLRLCAAFALVVLCMPPEGIPSVDLCLCKYWTHAPCPACGITRSGSNLVRGHLARSVCYHPFGLLIIPLIFGLGVLGLTPRSWRAAVRRRVVSWGKPLRPVYWLALTAFVVFGVLRWFLVFGGWVEFPATWP